MCHHSTPENSLRGCVQDLLDVFEPKFVGLPRFERSCPNLYPASKNVPKVPKNRQKIPGINIVFILRVPC
jgi:hypothetical protein